MLAVTPGTTVPPHYHARFAETFDLLEGAVTAYLSAQEAPPSPAGDEGADLDLLERSARALEPRREVTVPPGVHHKYVVGGVDTVLRVVVTPGDADFERLLMVLNGLAEDGELESMGDSVLLMAVISKWAFLIVHLSLFVVPCGTGKGWSEQLPRLLQLSRWLMTWP